MSGRHGHKRKRKKPTEHKATAPAIQVPAAKQDTGTEPQGTDNTLTEKMEEGGYMNWKTIRKPDPFDVALWGLILAFAVGAIYYFQLTTMQKQLDVMDRDQRAWISMDVSVNGPLIFTPETGSIPIKMTFTNVGHSPAQDVRPATRLAILWSMPTRDQLESFCQAYAQQSNEPNEINGWTLFPTQRQEVSQPAVIFKQDIEAGLAHSPEPGYVAFHLIACVDYTFAFGAITHHHTRQAYAVAWYDPNTQRAVGTFKPGQYAQISLFMQPISFAD